MKRIIYKAIVAVCLAVVSAFSSGCMPAIDYNSILSSVYEALEDDHAVTEAATDIVPLSLVDINKYREDYDFGSCRNLRGKVAVVIFYMDDFESSWTDDEMDTFTKNEIEPGLQFIEEQAKKFNIELDLSIEDVYRSVYYDDEIVIDTKKEGVASVDSFSKGAKAAGFSDSDELIEYYRTRSHADEVIGITVFNKNGAGYGINPKPGYEDNTDEHCVIFSHDLGSTGKEPVGSQAAIVALDILYLYGAENYYSIPSRKKIAQLYCPHDIMLSAAYAVNANNISEVTAFYIGWTDDLPVVMYADDWHG